uniref:Uncharacterized protein n=1 Tax=Avena sativa TaxID=4498 RepID=A0ACD6A3D5_AVESA
MVASCERCKRRDEQDYRELDDREKYFLMLIMGDFQHEMIIPEEFVRRLKGEIPGEIKLETRNGYSYTIGVCKNEKNFVLTVGWVQFVKNFDLQMGDSIILRYNGNSQFNLIIFDKLGREKALSVVVDALLHNEQERSTEATETVNRSHGQHQSMQMQSTEAVDHFHPMQMQPSGKTVNRSPMQPPPMKRQRRLRRDQSSQVQETTLTSSFSVSSGDSFSSEDGHGLHSVPGYNYVVGKKTNLSSVQKKQLNDGYIATRRTKLTSVQEEQVKEKVQSMHTDTPIFVAVMCKINVVSPFVLTVPNFYAQKYLGDEQSVVLQHGGETWKVRFCGRQRESLNDRRFESGWQKFVQDNNLKMGNICLFERLGNQRCTLKVHIIRVNDGS